MAPHDPPSNNDALALADARRDYRLSGLQRTDLADDPLDQLQIWLDQAFADGRHPEPTAMTLATVDPDGRPSARVVLLKGLDARGLAFYTNYESRKGQALAHEPRAALAFYWPHLERQVRIEGRVSRMSQADSEAYFARRPRGSRLGAWASPQSDVLPDRAALEAHQQAVEERFADAGDAVPLPPFWGGYRLLPDRMEFWQGRTNRLHDRLRYRRDADDAPWTIERLAP